MATRSEAAFAALVAGGLLLGCLASPVIASEEGRGVLEEIVVTAQKREERLQDVPLAITAFSGDYLERMGIKNLQELTSYTPSLRFLPGNSIRNASLSVRGIGSNGQNAGVAGSVGLYLDGVYIPRQAGLLNNLADINTVELLRGPQGTLYGVNTPAGLLNVNTRRPSDTFEGKVTVGMGNFESREVTGYLSGPLGDNVFGRVTYWSTGNEGTVKMIQGGHTNSFDDTGVRGRLLWAPSDRVEYEVIADYSVYNAKCCDGEWSYISDESLATFTRMANNLGLDRNLVFPSRQGDGYQGFGERIDQKTYSDGDGEESFEHYGLSLRASMDVLDGHTLDIVAAARTWDSDQDQENDEVGADFSVFPGQIEEQDTYSLEVRLSSPTGQFFEYTVGAFLFWNDSEFVQQTQLLAPLCLYSRNTQSRVTSGSIPDTTAARARCEGWWRYDRWTQDATSYAAFAETTFNFTEQFDLSLGVRVTEDDKEADKTIRLFDETHPQNAFGAAFESAAFTDEVDNVETTWSATARYTLADQPIMFFARAAKGYKAPGINARPIRFPTIPRVFGPEESINYEAGMKSMWLDNRLMFNLTVYLNNFDDLQAQASNPASDPSGGLGFFIQNAGELEHKGAEVEYQWAIADWLSVSGAVAYLDSEFKEFRGTPCAETGFHDVPVDPSGGAGLCDQTGLTNVAAPEWRHNTTLDAGAPIAGTDMEWFARWTATFLDDHDTAEDKDFRGFQDSFWLHDVAVGVNSADGTWEVKGWVKNLTDEEYIVSGGNTNVPANFGSRGAYLIYLGLPRMYGLEFSYNFR